MVNIITDSTADLGRDLFEQYNITVVPLYVTLQERSYVDGIEIGIEDLFASVEKTGQLPKTSAASLSDFYQVFQQPGEHIYIGISSQLSATVRNAQLAAEQVETGRVLIIDSLNLSAGIGLLVLKAAELRDAGYSASDIAKEVQLLLPKVRTSFIIETLEYLYKGGRCSAMQNIVGSLLQIRPIIAVQPDGKLSVREKVRGNRQKALIKLIDDVKSKIEWIDLQRIFITHTGCQADAQILLDELRSIAPFKEIHITTAGSVIASHCGPDTIGILYLMK